MTDLDYTLNIFNYLKSGAETGTMERSKRLIVKLFTDKADNPYKQAFLKATMDYINYMQGKDYEVDKDFVLPEITYPSSAYDYYKVTGDNSVFETIYSETPITYRAYNIATKGLSAVC